MQGQLGRWRQRRQKRKAFVVSMAIREPRLGGPFDKAFASPFTIARINAERLALIRQLIRLGYRVAVPKYAEAHDEKLFSRLPTGVRVFKAKPPIAGKVRVGEEEVAEMHPSTRWVRNLWQKTPAGRVKRFSGVDKNVVRFIKSSFGVSVETSSRPDENAFGHGAKSIFLPNNVVIANKGLKKNQIVENLRKKGVKFYFVKSAKTIERTSLMPHKILSFDVDLFVGTVGKALLVDSGFYLRNLLAVRGAARRAGLKILFVPKSERALYPANFLVLEPNKAIVDKDAKQTIALLRQNMVEVIPTVVPLRGNRKAGGGVHCIVNEL